MEVSYELLWKICSGFLLSFLVSGLVSFILYCSNPTLDDEKVVKSKSTGGKKKKRVKFVDQVDEIRRVDDGFVKDIEVDEVNRLVGVGKSGKKDEILLGESGERDEILMGESGEEDKILMGESGDDCVGLVDLSEKGEILVGFDGGVVKECVDVGVCLGSDVVDDQREENSTNSRMELGSSENEVDKTVQCDADVSLDSDELIDDHRERNLMNSSNVYVEEVHDVDRVDHDIDLVHGKEEVVDDQRDEEAKSRNNVGSKQRSGGVFDGEGMLNDEEEWEGIERSDLAEEFARAKFFLENDDKERWLAMVGGNDLMMQLYGLEKVAMEGPCHEPQPMALKFAARAKWNAWQKLGNMSPEEAMDQYIYVLSQNVPKWMEGHSSEEGSSLLVEEKVRGSADAQISTSAGQQSGSTNLRNSKVSDLADATAVDQDKE